ncbi:type I-C CRISPR-associated protein Cas8c/Csd1 [Deinococcus budaensis]|uniref:CRISPR-associated protein Csd1 n=1 Tax=Deinococcus budaensis TaxID=1665626 RepID=A0A7W8GGH3_9DEIO|nr:type I-C CRISPR-associated protein Cas8c/Csd1 [Deinococcus budaensis]MBB5235197.1 CRISPR-associated protein Csd1 [Deinococcus budaensis]
MLLEQLMRYEDRMRAEGRVRAQASESGAGGDEMPFMYAAQPVRWEVRLKADGTVRDVQPLSSGKTKGKDLGAPLAAPNLIRTVGIKARLLMDNAEYALGIPKKEGDKNTLKRHDAFRQLVRVCAEATEESSVLAVARFLDGLDPAAFREKYLAAFPDFAPDTNVTFSVEGVRPIDQPSVRTFWAAQFGREAGSALVAECLITGEVGPVMDMEPVKIKGISGGQTSGMNFISANAGAFESYGLHASQIAPVRLEVAEKYANGLNRLLADPATSLRVGGVTYAFWTREGGMPPVGQTLSQPGRFPAQKRREKKARTEEVRNALWSALTGQQSDLKAEAPFYTVGLTPSGSRIAVRTHLTSTVGDAVDHLAAYFEAQTIAAMREEDEGKTYGVFQLVGAMYRDASKEHIAPDVDALVQHALTGAPLPRSFLVRLSNRNRADAYRVTRPRAALTKMVLLSRDWKEFDVTDANLEALDPRRPEPAYHLGRLLAVLDDVQSSVMRANTTLVDRFYGSMSTTPYAVVGRLMHGSQAHLQKLRKENEAAYFSKQRALEDVMGSLKDIPAKPLSTPEQALFSLGYYHQRAAISLDIRERSAAKKAKAAQGTTPDDDTQTSEGDAQ